MKTWRQDFQASIVVALVALPLCLGIALASNAPLSSGLIAGIIGGIVVGMFSGSNVSISGPAAGLTVIVAGSISTLGSFEALTMAVFVSGLIQIFFGLLKGGVIGDYFPSAVVKGMLAAIGLIIILKQFPHAIGYDSDFMGDVGFSQIDGQNTFTEIILAFKWLHLGALIISLTTISFMLTWDHFASKGVRALKMFPSGLAAVVLSIMLNYLFNRFMPQLALGFNNLVQIPLEGVMKVSLPNWSMLTNLKLYQVAFTIAVIGSLETLLSIEASDKLDPQRRTAPKNRELVAQGIGNTLSGLIGGLPITSVLVRTTTNITAGNKTRMSAILHGFWLLICVLTIPHLLNMIPLAALASVLLLVGYKLVKPSLFKGMFNKGLNQFAPFLATIVAILLTDLLSGVLIGTVIGFVFVIRSNIHKSIVVARDDGTTLIRFHKDVSFLQKSTLSKIFEDIKEGQRVIIDGSNSVFVDHDIEDLIEDFIEEAKSRNVDVSLKKSSLALNSLFKE